MGSAFLLSAFLSFVIHWPMIVHDPLTSRDDHMLVNPLFDVHSLKQYWIGLKTGKIMDFQPVRDFSFWLDIHSTIRLGFGVFHLGNVLVWIACLAICARILRREIKHPEVGALCLIFLAIHPSIASTVAWVSARKHLLACFFALLATHIALKVPGDNGAPSGKGVRLSIIITYALSILAQPIQLFLPLWIALRGFLEKQAALIRTALACVPIAVAVAAVNYWYYNLGTYKAVSPASKFATAASFTEGIGIPVLSLGRHFFQIVAPFWVSAEYYPGSIQNIIGVVLMPLFVWVCLKRIDIKTSVSWLFFTFLPIGWIVAARTNIFVSDSYLLLPLIGFSVLLGKLLDPCAESFKRCKPIFQYVGVATFAALVIFFSILSSHQSFSWRSDDAIWENAFRTNRTPHNVAYIGLRFLDQKKYDDAYALAREDIQWAPYDPTVSVFYARAVYMNPKLSVDEKLKLLEAARHSGIWPTYFGSVLFAQKGKFDLAFMLSQRALMSEPGSFAGEFEIAVAESYAYCKHIRPLVECDAMVTKQRKKYDRWSEEAFKARLASLKVEEQSAQKAKSSPLKSPAPAPRASSSASSVHP